MVELAAEPLHVHVDDVRHGIVAIVPDMLGDVRPADDISRTTREVLEQGILPRRQGDIMRADAHAAAAGVERERADHDPLGQEGQTAAADESPEPREQLAEVERFDQVVVGAAIEALDPRIDGVPRGHDQDRHARTRRANRAAHGEAVLAPAA